jgi:hypothetical protein
MDVPRAVVDLLRRFGKQRDDLVSSFDLRCLLDVRAIAPEMALALIGKLPAILALAEQHRLPWVHGEHTTVTREPDRRVQARPRLCPGPGRVPRPVAPSFCSACVTAGFTAYYVYLITERQAYARWPRPPPPTTRTNTRCLLSTPAASVP